jgi:hypothetical protein
MKKCVIAPVRARLTAVTRGAGRINPSFVFPGLRDAELLRMNVADLDRIRAERAALALGAAA